MTGGSRACLVCGGAFVPDRIPGLLTCRGCGFVSADLSLSDAQLAELYSHRYFHGEEYRDYVAERPLAERQFAARLRTLLRFVPDAGQKRLYEIGAAYGYFLGVAAPAFQQVEGIDISAEAAASARATVGVDVATGDFLDAEVDGPLDVVCLWDTIEHLGHPDRYIARAATLMPPGGVLALTTGDIESLVARVRGRRWRQIHPPTHLHYFSKRTLTRLLDAHGFDVRYVEYSGVLRSVDTMAYIILAVKQRQAGLYRLLKRLRLLDWHLSMNLYDTVMIVAVKRA